MVGDDDEAASPSRKESNTEEMVCKKFDLLVIIKAVPLITQRDFVLYFILNSTNIWLQLYHDLLLPPSKLKNKNK